MESQKGEVNSGEKEEKAVSVYEVSYILLPQIAVTEIDSRVFSLHEILGKAGAEIISNENPVLIDLAYPMTKVLGTTRQKVTSGYFGWIKFEVKKDTLLSIKQQFENNSEIIRFLIIKTVRENTLLFEKMKFQKEEKTKREVDVDDTALETVPVEQEVKKIRPEDIDKSIDDLVIV